MDVNYIDSIEMLRQQIEKLKKNEQNLSKEELTGKYAKAYQKMQDEIKNSMISVFIENTCYLLVPETFVQEGREMVRSSFEQRLKDMNVALRKEYDVDKFVAICDEVNKQIIAKAFSIPVEDWNSNTRFHINPWMEGAGKIVLDCVNV